MSDLIRSSHDNAVAIITIDRPADGNVLTLDMLRELTAAIKSAAVSDAKVIALRSTGADFCRGRDPKGGPVNPTTLVMRDQILQPILDVYAALNEAPQPTVCAVQGAALGFGCAMATACDVTIAAAAEIRSGRAQRDHLGIAHRRRFNGRSQRAQHVERQHVALRCAVNGDAGDGGVA